MFSKTPCVRGRASVTFDEATRSIVRVNEHDGSSLIFIVNLVETLDLMDLMLGNESASEGLFAPPILR